MKATDSCSRRSARQGVVLDSDRLPKAARPAAASLRIAPSAFAGGIAVAGSALIYTVYEEAALSAPVIMVSARLGGWAALLIFVPAYAVGGFVLSELLVRSYRRGSTGRKGQLHRWVQRSKPSESWLWARKLLLRSGWLGFILSSAFLGPLVTTLLVSSLKKSQVDPTRIAALSSFVFSVTFVAPYCGLGRLVASFL